MLSLRKYIPLSVLLLPAFAAAAPRPSADAQGGPQAARQSLVLEECELPGMKEKARCGTYEVFENRAARRGRKIKLKVVVLPATGQVRAPDPYFFIEGGPGSSSTESAPYLARDLASIRERRDLVFLDQRGTGGSHPLNCPLFDPKDLQSYLREFLPPEAVRRCRAELEAKADLRLYTTPIAADDLEEVRVALGYGKINILGGSYGTRAALVYLKRHPASVRTLTLQGVAPTSKRMTHFFPRDAQRALDGVLGECERDAPCRAAFPSIRTEARAVFDRLKKSPASVEVLNPKSGALARVTLSRNLAGEAVRYMLYQAGSATRIPAVLHQAARGDFTPLAEAALSYRENMVDSGSNGLYISITCAEDIPFVPGDGDPKADETFIGNYRLIEQRAACRLWPRSDVPADYAAPTRSDVPALILTGTWDPVTPPSQGDEAAQSLPNGLHVVVPQGGHGFGGLEGTDCIRRLMSEFVERGSTKGLDTSCVSRIKRRPFLTQPPELKVVALGEAELSRLAGHYVVETGTMDVDVAASGGGLKLSMSNGQTFLLAPVSPVRFRAAGAPGIYVTFDVTDGKVTRVRAEQNGVEAFTLVPKKVTPPPSQ